METARERILYFIENQDIKPKDFLMKTSLKKGFLDKSHAKSGASDIYLSKILESYPQLSAEWLITGKGEMLKASKVEKKEFLEVRIDRQEREIDRLNTIVDIIVTKLQLGEEIRATKPNYTEE